MDTIWTPEFAEAGWLREITGQRVEKTDALDDVLDGPKAPSAEEQDLRGAAEHQRPAALVPQGPRPHPAETWDEMIAMAKSFRRARADPRAGPEVRGLRGVVQQPRRLRRRNDRQRRRPPTLGAPAVKAAQIIKDVATSGRADPVALDRPGGPGHASRSRPARPRSCSTGPTSTRRRRTDAADQRDDQARVAEHGLGSVPVGVSGRAGKVVGRRCQHRRLDVQASNPKQALAAALCMTRYYWQNQEAINEGLPPVTIAVLSQPVGRSRVTRSPRCCSSSWSTPPTVPRRRITRT